MNRSTPAIVALTLSLCSPVAQAAPEVFALTLREAERAALETSNLLKSASADEEAASDQAGAQLMNLLPKLSIQGSYLYEATIPTIKLGQLGTVQFGIPQSYSVGPVLSYAIWDSFGALKAYHGASRLADARVEQREDAKTQVLESVRLTYGRVQLALEELRLTTDALALARAQDADVTRRFHAGASAKLDLVVSSRAVLNDDQQFRQKQADLASALRDLLAQVGLQLKGDLSHPGPPGVDGVTEELQIDSIKQTLKESEGLQIKPPGDSQHAIRTQELLAESSEYSAASQRTRSLPTIQVAAAASYTLPNIPAATAFTQETISASLSLPLYLGDPNWKLASQQDRLADSARFREAQLKIDLKNDFDKAVGLLESLRAQQKLATQDVAQSEEAARLYYDSYKAGRINLIDVQNANVQALQAKVNAARIDAQILYQLTTLAALGQ